MRIMCSRCGSPKEFKYTATNVLRTLMDGWGSFGSALYCPECSETWNERNSKCMSVDQNTIDVIDELYARTRR